MAIVSDAHLAAFGKVIYEYANVETGLKFCLAGLLDQPPHITMILTEPYSALNLRTVLKVVAKECKFPDETYLPRIVAIIGEFKPFGALRNSIAHSRWTQGGRPGSIKPRGVDIRSERAIFRGSDEEERDWTADEMQAAAKSLSKLNRDLLQFMQDAGLTERIERHIDRMSDDKS